MDIMDLIKAVKESDIHKINELIESGVDVNQNGEEQAWTPLNYAAGKGDMEIAKLLISSGADIFKTGRDNRTPYMIALAAGRVEMVKYLHKLEECNPEKAKNSSRRERKYCKAYYLKDLRKFSGWSEDRINWKKNKADGNSDDKDLTVEEFKDDNVVFIHQDFTVTQSMYHNQNVIYNNITTEWEQFLANNLKFKVPDDLDLIVPNKENQEKTQTVQPS